MHSLLMSIGQALTVIEYLIANGSERAVDDIVEHTFQISVRVVLSNPDNDVIHFRQ